MLLVCGNVWLFLLEQLSTLLCQFHRLIRERFGIKQKGLSVHEIFGYLRQTCTSGAPNQSIAVYW